MLDNLETVRECSKRIGVPEHQVRIMCREGLLEAYKNASNWQWLIPRDKCQRDPLVGYWTVPEAAEAWGISVTSVKERVRSGEVPARRCGQAWYLQKGTPPPQIRGTTRS